MLKITRRKVNLQSSKSRTVSGMRKQNPDWSIVSRSKPGGFLVLGKKKFIALMEDIVVESLEKNFPKGKCSECGAALVMQAEIRIALKTILLGDA